MNKKSFENSPDDLCGFILEVETGFIDGIYYNQGIHNIADIAAYFDEKRPQYQHIPCLVKIKNRPKYIASMDLSDAPEQNNDANATGLEKQALLCRQAFEASGYGKI